MHPIWQLTASPAFNLDFNPVKIKNIITLQSHIRTIYFLLCQLCWGNSSLAEYFLSHCLAAAAGKNVKKYDFQYFLVGNEQTSQLYEWDEI